MLTATDGQFVLDLAPRHPIYVQLIAPEARAALGNVHREGRPALAMLEKEGFERTGLVDIFDGGPTMAVARDQLSAVRTARSLTVRLGNPHDAPLHLVATTDLPTFRSARCACALGEGHATLTPETARLLGVAEGDTIRAKAH
ncbi:arginine N-succinyltransferase [Novosphingobium sp. 1949]|uniref:Arginine N-succinyltransferase n=1 Tax=Novosphingobium organovorum TaxID=2930092 RepID=A0ABT0BAA8_9SPHN|nr:arginine N-succinyltransferase [Novosphingobium organovorum]MCJ2181984.1 arginine N-succinyltransferase [Novosphingobium organovorum]